MNRKISDKLLLSTDVNLRLATDFMKEAMTAAKQGNIKDFCTCIRLAASFEEKINRGDRLGL